MNVNQKEYVKCPMSEFHKNTFNSKVRYLARVLLSDRNYFKFVCQECFEIFLIDGGTLWEK